MKLRCGFVVREIAGKTVVISVNPKNSFRGMLSLNPSATVLWRRLEQTAEREDLIQTLIGEYEIDRDVAERDTDAFLDTLRQHRLLEQE